MSSPSFAVSARFVAMAVVLSLASATQAAAPTVGQVGEAALAMVANANCTVSATRRANPTRYLLVDGSACPVGGGACEAVAIIRLDGRTTVFKRTGEPSTDASGKFSATYSEGDRRLRVDYAALPRDAKAARSATLHVTTQAGTATVKGFVSCDGG